MSCGGRGEALDLLSTKNEWFGLKHELERRLGELSAQVMLARVWFHQHGVYFLVRSHCAEDGQASGLDLFLFQSFHDRDPGVRGHEGLGRVNDLVAEAVPLAVAINVFAEAVGLFLGDAHQLGNVEVFVQLSKLALLMAEEAPSAVEAVGSVDEGPALSALVVDFVRDVLLELLVVTVSKLTLFAVAARAHFNPIFTNLGLILRAVDPPLLDSGLVVLLGDLDPALVLLPLEAAELALAETAGVMFVW